MDFLFQAFIGTFIVTFSFLVLSIASAGKDHFNTNVCETVFQYEEVEKEIDEEIEEVTYEELDEKVSLESLKQRGSQINAKYSEIS